MEWSWKIFPTLQLNTCKEHKLLPWYSITKCNVDAFLVKLQDILVCKCNVYLFMEAKHESQLEKMRLGFNVPPRFTPLSNV